MDADRRSDVPLRHFRAFSTVVRTGRLSTASLESQRSPSALSRSIAILENAFGCSLMVRGQSRLTSSVTGALVAQRCALISRELSDCRDQISRFGRAPIRRNAALFEMLTDTSHLRALVAVHDFKSVRRAAQVLSVSQPAISYSVRLLEADLGIELFSRMPTGMIATPAGITVTVCARRILSEISKMFDDVRSAEGISTGVVCVGGLAYSRTALLPEAIKRVLSRHPNIVVRTVEGPIDHLLASLLGDEIDTVLCAYPDRALLNGVDIEPIAHDPMGLFVSHDHPLAQRSAIGHADLLAYPFILPPEGSITRKLLERFFTDHGYSAPEGRAETSSNSVVRNLLIGSHNIAFRSLREFHSLQSDDKIVPLDVTPRLPERQICVLQRKGVQLTAAVGSFLKIVREVAESGERPGSRKKLYEECSLP